jgi:hypothetical protein
MIVAANALNEPDCGAVADAQVPTGMHRNAGLNLQRTNAPLSLYVLERIGIDLAKDWRARLTEERIASDLAVKLHPLPMVDGEALIGNHVCIINGGNQREPVIRLRFGRLIHPMRMILSAGRADE